MAEAFVNSICKLIMISGEQAPAPYVGVSAQIDVMQDFMSGDMMQAISAPEELDGPEAIEAYRNSIQAELDDDAPDALTDLETPSDINVWSGLEAPTQQIAQYEFTGEFVGEEGENSEEQAGERGLSHSRGGRPLPAIAIAIGATLLPYVPKIAMALKNQLPRLARGTVAFCKNWRAWWPAIRGACKNPKQLWQSIKNFKWGAVTSTMQTATNMGTELVSNLQMVQQFTQLNQYLQYVAPGIGNVVNDLVYMDTTLDQMFPPPQAPEPPETPETPEENPEDLPETPVNNIHSRNISRGTTTTTTQKVAAPRNIQNYQLVDLLRMLVLKLPEFERQFRVLNANMTMNKGLIPQFLAGKENSTISPKDMGLAEILFRALNIPDKKTSAVGVTGPTEIFSLAEQFDRAFPIVEVIDPITKKKSTVSIFEIIMQAQSAKVIELGPGFLKWYPDLDVLDSRQAVTTTPVTGT